MPGVERGRERAVRPSADVQEWEGRAAEEPLDRAAPPERVPPPDQVVPRARPVAEGAVGPPGWEEVRPEPAAAAGLAGAADQPDAVAWAAELPVAAEALAVPVPESRAKVTPSARASSAAPASAPIRATTSATVGRAEMHARATIRTAGTGRARVHGRVHLGVPPAARARRAVEDSAARARNSVAP